MGVEQKININHPARPWRLAVKHSQEAEDLFAPAWQPQIMKINIHDLTWGVLGWPLGSSLNIWGSSSYVYVPSGTTPYPYPIVSFTVQTPSSLTKIIKIYQHLRQWKAVHCTGDFPWSQALWLLQSPCPPLYSHLSSLVLILPLDRHTFARVLTWSRHSLPIPHVCLTKSWVSSKI